MSTIPPVSDPRFDPTYGQPEQPEKKRSPWTTCLIGCLVTLVVLFVISAILVYWISQQWRNWTSTAIAEGIKQGINSSQLPEQEKVDINVQVDRLAEAFRTGKLTFVQLGELMQEISQSPLMTSIMASAVDSAYLADSGLSDEEKAAGRTTLQRFLRGVIDEKINQQGIDAAMAHVAVRQPNGEWQLRQKLSDAELRAFFAAAKTEADQAGIEAEPADFDPSEEFKRIVDQALGQANGDRPGVPDERARPVEIVMPDDSAKVSQ